MFSVQPHLIILLVVCSLGFKKSSDNVTISV